MDILMAILAAAFGLIIGSFLNCLIWRLYKEETLSGRSYCPNCRQMIAWYDNIPLISFIVLRGRCRHCQKNISWQYPAVEIITALLFLLIWLKDSLFPGSFLLLARDWLIIVSLVIVFVYDFRWQLMPMTIVWPMTAIVFVLNLFLGFPWYLILLTAAIGAAFFLLQYLITSRRGLGVGDIWLGLFLGAAFPNWSELLLIMVISYTLGALISLVLVKTHKKAWKSKIALGPFLASGAIITLIWGSGIWNWYLQLFLLR